MARASSSRSSGSSGRAATSAMGRTSPRFTASTHSGPRRRLPAHVTPSLIPHRGDRRWARRGRRSGGQAVELLAHPRRDLGAVELDAAHHQLVGQRAGAVLEVEARQRRGRRRPARSWRPRSRASRRTARRRARSAASNCVAGHRRPAPLGADAGVHRPVVRPAARRGPARRCRRRGRGCGSPTGSAGWPSSARARR